MRLEIIWTAILFFGGSFLTGHAVRRLLKLKKEGILFSILSGVMGWWALMELILIPMTMKLSAFQSFVYVYTAMLLLTAAFGLCCWREILEEVLALPKKVGKYLTFGHIVAFALICYQLWFIHHHMYLEWDDAYYVNLANEAIHSNKIYWVYPETGSMVDFDKRYVLSLWPIFYAWLSRLTGVAPTVMAHTIFPWLILPSAYMIYALIGKELFNEEAQTQGMFLALAVMLHLFMSGAHTSGLTFLSITPWIGKGVLASVLLPMLFYCVLRIERDASAGNWTLLGITAFGGCLLSSMGILLIPVFIGGSVFLLACMKKDIRYFLCGVAMSMPCIVLGIYYIRLTH